MAGALRVKRLAAWWAVGLAAHGLAVSAALACDDVTVRDAAFRAPRDIHRLCVMYRGDQGEAARRIERLRDWLAGEAAGLNLEVVPVDAADPDVRWSEYALPSAPPTLPVVVLAGRRTADRKSFFIDHWEPAPSREELDALRTSPAREAIRREVGKRAAVLLFIPGTAPSAGKAEGVLERVVEQFNREQPLGLAVVRVERHDPRERLLLSFAGVPAEGDDWVGVVFGPGKIMPPLQGDAITAEGLNEQLAALTAACTCLQSPSRLGVDLPMVWSRELSDAATLLASRAAGEPTEDGGTDEFSPPLTIPANVMAASSPAPHAAQIERRLWLIAAVTGTGLVLLAGLAFLWQRRARKAPADSP